jgi:hypothetical protein
MFSNPPPSANFGYAPPPPPPASNSNFSHVSMPPRGPAPTTQGTGYGGISGRPSQLMDTLREQIRSYVESNGVVRPPPRSSDCATRLPTASFCHDITNVPSMSSSFRRMGRV